MGGAGATLREAARAAGSVLSAHKLRSALVVLGVAIGVTTLMAMVSILVGLERKITRDVRSSDNVVVRLAKVGIVVHGDRKLLDRPDLTALDWQAIRSELAEVRAAEIVEGDVASRMFVLHWGDEKSNLVQVFGTASVFPRIYNLALVAGRYLSEEEVLHARRVAVLGYGPLTDLFPRLDPIGKRVRIGPFEYTVVGAFAERNSLFGRLADNFVAIPYGAFRKDFARRNQVFTAIDMVPAEGVSAEEMSDAARALMRARRKLAPGEKDNFELISQDQVQELLGKVTGPVGIALVVIASIGLMVGGIGVMAILLVSVTERTREIGLRMALGARRRDILWQFLVEASLLTGLGGVIGIAGGLGCAALAEALFQLPASAPLGYVLLALLVSAGVGLVFGLYPASRASRLDPVVAMRAE